MGLWLVRIKEQAPLKNTCLNHIALRVQNLLTTPHSRVNTIVRTYIFGQGINKKINYYKPN